MTWPFQYLCIFIYFLSYIFERYLWLPTAALPLNPTWRLLFLRPSSVPLNKTLAMPPSKWMVLKQNMTIK